MCCWLKASCNAGKAWAPLFRGLPCIDHRVTCAAFRKPCAARAGRRLIGSLANGNWNEVKRCSSGATSLPCCSTGFAWVDGLPWAIHTALVPMRIAAAVPALTGPDSRVANSDFSLYKTFDEAGLEIDHADETINVRLATGKEAEHLGIERPSAVMLVHRKSFDNRGNLIELIEAVYLQDCYTYDTRLVRSSPLSVLRNGSKHNASK